MYNITQNDSVLLILIEIIVTLSNTSHHRYNNFSRNFDDHNYLFSIFPYFFVLITNKKID